MDFNALSKEAKQKLVLAVMCGAGLLYAGYSFGLSPLVSRVAQLEVDAETLEQETTSTRRALRREIESRDKLKTLSEQIAVASASHIPPAGSPLSWVSGRLNAAARSAGVSLDAVEGVGQRSAADTGRRFKTFGVRVTLSGSYFDLVNLLRYLDQENPFMSIVEMNVRVNEDEPEVQRLYLQIEWPIWSKAEDSDRISS